MRRIRGSLLAAGVMLGAGGLTACGDDGNPRDAGPDARTDGATMDGGMLPTAPPTTFEQVADMGFQSPTDAVASPDGTTFYFAAFSTGDDPLPAIFTLPSDGSAAPTARFEGPPLEYPSGLVLSCDGSTLYIADTAADPDDDGVPGAVFALTLMGATAPMPLGITSLSEPNALAMGPDCETLAISGRTVDGTAVAVLRAPRAGGAATIAAMGGDLVAPTGLHVDADDVLWALDHLAQGDDGQGVLYSIGAGGPTEVVSGLLLGTPGGVSLTAGGGNIVIGSRRVDGTAILTTVELSTMTVSTTALPATFVDPAGLRTARSAGVFVFVDSEGSAIYRGE